MAKAAKETLTAKGIEAKKPPASGQVDIYDLGGPPGFHLRISSGGAKTFFVSYRRDGRRKKYKIGRFPAVTLAKARDLAKMVDASDDDPAGKKAAMRRAETFEELAEQFFESQSARLKPGTIKEWKRIEENELRPEFGAMKPHEITRGDVRAFLDAKAKTAPYMANRILEVIRRIYSWGVDVERVNASPCVGLKKPGVEKQRERVLSADEIRLVLDTLDKPKREGKDGKLVDASYARPLAKAFFSLAFFTAARKGELLSAKWADVDLTEKLWTLPETKMGRAHVIPLSPRAVEVLEEVRALNGTSAWVFRDPDGRISNHPKRSITDLRDETKLDFRIHDLRRTAATGLARLGIRLDTISAILNHRIGGAAATRAYEHHNRLPEMRRALDKWAREVQRIREQKAAKVVAIA